MPAHGRHPDRSRLSDDEPRAVGRRLLLRAVDDVARRRRARELAPAARIERLHERVQALLVEVGFLHGDNPYRVYDDLRAIAARADLDGREVTILLGIIRQIEWKLAQAGGGDAVSRRAIRCRHSPIISMNFSRSNGLRMELQTASGGIFSTPRLPAAVKTMMCGRCLGIVRRDAAR